MADLSNVRRDIEAFAAPASPAWANAAAELVEVQAFEPMKQPYYQYMLTAVDIPALVNFAEPTKATLAHVDTTTDLLNRHVFLYEGIVTELAVPTKPDGLTARVRAFFAKWGDGAADPDADVVATQAELRAQHPGPSLTRSMIASGSARPPAVTVDQLINPGGTATSDTAGLLTLTSKAMDDFHEVDGLAAALKRLKRTKMGRINASLKESARLEREIAAARAEYASLDRTRLAAEEDYTLVRGLLEEQLGAVDDAFVERRRLLSNPVALCYVRVNDLPVRIDHRAMPLIPDVDPDRLPVACDAAGELPGRLAPFLELLADQPMSAWRTLAKRWHLLPPGWVYEPPAPALPGYLIAVQALPMAFHGIAKAMPMPLVQRVEPWPGSDSSTRHRSQKALGRQAAERITLEQLTGVGKAALRIPARRLHDDLSVALACLLDQLVALPATDRFAWSRLAEDDRLSVEHPGRWPGFGAHQRTTAGVQLQAVVAWLFGQLADDAPSEARTAMRTTLRACLLHTVNDDPSELLRGEVVQPPGKWMPGVMAGATMNRVPELKAPLKVYDAERRLIGEAVVVDSQSQPQQAMAVVGQVQAQVEIVTTYVAAPVSYSGWTLVG